LPLPGTLPWRPVADVRVHISATSVDSRIPPAPCNRQNNYRRVCAEIACSSSVEEAVHSELCLGIAAHSHGWWCWPGGRLRVGSEIFTACRPRRPPTEHVVERPQVSAAPAAAVYVALNSRGPAPRFASKPMYRPAALKRNGSNASVVTMMKLPSRVRTRACGDIPVRPASPSTSEIVATPSTTSTPQSRRVRPAAAPTPARRGRPAEPPRKGPRLRRPRYAAPCRRPAPVPPRHLTAGLRFS
jgi:hypothetical protein